MRITRPIAVLLCGLVTLTLSPTVGASGQPYARSSVRLQVKPTQTEVYVDGAYTGLVDNYDGLFQRLHLPPGEHEIELYLGGTRASANGSIWWKARPTRFSMRCCASPLAYQARRVQNLFCLQQLTRIQRNLWDLRLSDHSLRIVLAHWPFAYSPSTPK